MRLTTHWSFLSSYSRSILLAAASRRSHATICMSSPRFTCTTCPGIGASFAAGDFAGAGGRTVATSPGSTGSTLRTVTGRSGVSPPGSTRSRMPKSAANFASGGFSSVRTRSGNDRALASGRPASSFNPSGSSIRNCCFSGSPGPNVTPVRSPVSVDFGSCAGHALPAASTSRIFCASAFAIGAVNDSESGRIGMHCASLFTRSHVNDARKAGRTLNASACAADVATPVVAAMPLPQTSFTSAPCGSVRAHASVTSGESGASRSRRNLSWSLPVVGSRNRKPRVRPSPASMNSTRR